MKKVLLSFTLIVTFISIATAQDEGVKLDLLKAPASPASNLLGIAPSDIDKPTDVSAFMLSLQKAGGGLLTALPTNYAVDLAPYWLFKKKMGDITTQGLATTTGANVFKQTFVLSFAMRSTDSTEADFLPNTVYAGIGFKFAVVRGRYDATTIDALDAIHKWQVVQVNAQRNTLLNYQKDINVIELQTKRKNLLRDKFTTPGISDERKAEIDRDILAIDSSLGQQLLVLKDATKTEAKEKIKELAASFQTARVGFTWDVAGGVSTSIVNRRLGNARIYNAGVWTTIGYTSEKVGSGLLLLRLLQNPDKIFAKDNGINDMGDIATFDFGGRYIYSTPQSKFNASLEGVYRSVLSSNTIKPSWRIVFNADYAIWANQKLSFSFGRNFDGTTTKDGNLIAALGFLTGFGNRR
jgi:hypothetical protein